MGNILLFLKTNKDAITSIGILITFVVSATSMYFNVRNNRAVHYVNSVTKSRIDWIQKLRILTSDFIANTNIYNNAYYKEDYEKTGLHLSKCQKICSEITLLLNSCDSKDKEIIVICNEILENFRKYYDEVHSLSVDSKGYYIETDYSKECKNNVETKIELLTLKIQLYLKAEWNRVKYESKGKVYEKDIQDFDYTQLVEKHKNPSFKDKKYKRFYLNLWVDIRNIFTSPVFTLIVLFLIVVFIISKVF